MRERAWVRTMIARRAIAERRVDLVDVFLARAEARAYLWSIGDLDLHEAVDVLQADAECDGLVERIGQDGVQEIIAAAFRPLREDAP
jgi:hypothetical protein